MRIPHLNRTGALAKEWIKRAGWPFAKLLGSLAVITLLVIGNGALLNALSGHEETLKTLGSQTPTPIAVQLALVGAIAAFWHPFLNAVIRLWPRFDTLRPHRWRVTAVAVLITIILGMPTWA